MIDSAVLKLTGWYLLLIMALSIGFSITLYRIGTFELERGLRRQGTALNEIAPPDWIPDFEQLRRIPMKESQERLRVNLALFNVIVFVGGGAASYVLARRTLRPIHEAFVAQSRFTADASHELRTPLTAMQTEIEVALRSHDLTKTEAVQLLQSNLEEVAKLRALSDDLLKLTQTGDGQETLVKVDLKTITDSAVKQVRALANKKQIVIENTAEKIVVKGNHLRLTELIVILLDNAIKYSDAKTTIKIITKQHSHSVAFSLSLIHI